MLSLSRAMSRDPADYPEPEDFRPERFLTAVDGKLVPNKTIRDPFSFAFGFGRRYALFTPYGFPIH